MKILGVAAVLMLSALSFAQNTVVSGQILDPAGNKYVNATITANFNNPDTKIANWNGFPLTVTTWSTNADSNANFTLNIPDLNSIGPAVGTFYTFRVCSTFQNLPSNIGQPSNPCFTYTSPACPNAGCITGATITITAALQAVSVSLPVVTSPASLTANNTFTGNNTFSGNITTKTINSVINPTFYAGTDIGAQVNTAFASADCPSAGCRIIIPAGSYTFSTPIVFSGAKPVSLECSSGANGLPVTAAVTLLTYSGTGAAITFNNGGFTGSGLKGCTLFGPSTSGTTVGIQLATGGGSAIGDVLRDDDISNFGTCIQSSGALSFLWKVQDSSIHDCGNGGSGHVVVLTIPGENISAEGSLFSNQTSGYDTGCITISGAAEFGLHSSSLDQCGVTMSSPNARFEMHSGNFENPNGATSSFFLTTTNTCTQCSALLAGVSVFEDGLGTGRTAMFSNGANNAKLTIIGGQVFFGTEATPANLVANVAGSSTTIVDPKFNTPPTNTPLYATNAGAVVSIHDGQINGNQSWTLFNNGAHFNCDASANGDTCGTKTLAGGAGSVTFGTAYGFNPVCTCTDQTAANAVKCSTTASTLSITGTGTDVIAYQCFGNPN